MLFEALTQDERDKIFDPKRAAKLPTKDSNQDGVSPSKLIEPEPQESPQQAKKQQKSSENAENDAVCTNTRTVLVVGPHHSSFRAPRLPPRRSLQAVQRKKWISRN